MAEESSGGTTCRLIRQDGSEWIVSRFELREGGAWITARRVPAGEARAGGADGHVGSDRHAHGAGNGGGLANGQGNGHGKGRGTILGNGHGAERLCEAPLEHGDRLVWTREDGTVAWAMRNPTGVGLAWRHDDSSEEDDFFAGDFN